MASFDSPAHQPERIKLGFIERRKVERIKAARERDSVRMKEEAAENIGKVALLKKELPAE